MYRVFCAAALLTGVTGCFQSQERYAFHDNMEFELFDLDRADDLRAYVPGARMHIDVDPDQRIPSIIENTSHLLGELEGQDLGPRLRRLAEEHHDWHVVARALAATARALVG